jgi:hypothetical protein
MEAEENDVLGSKAAAARLAFGGTNITEGSRQRDAPTDRIGRGKEGGSNFVDRDDNLVSTDGRGLGVRVKTDSDRKMRDGACFQIRP